MNEQPEALRLADWCEAHSSGIYRPSAEAAAELRRLHAENKRYDAECFKLLQSWNDAERRCDKLLEALKAMLTHMGMDEDEWNKPTFEQARAAIKAAEEGK